MSQYPLCKKYGLKVFRLLNDFPDPDELYIKASEVEHLLASGCELYGDHKDHHLAKYSTGPCEDDTHVGILVGYKPIEKEQPVSVDEVVNLLETFNLGQRNVNDLINRLQKAGLK